MPYKSAPIGSAVFSLGVIAFAAFAPVTTSAQQTMLRVRIENVSDSTTLNTSKGAQPVPLSPGVWVVHSGVNPIFAPFEPVRGNGLEELAEDGKNAPPAQLATALRGQPGVKAVGTFEGIKPAETIEFAVPADPGDQLSFVTMFSASNDLFYAPYGIGIPLFSDGTPIRGGVTSMVALWDAGTEENQEPGVGPAIAPNQPHPDFGPKANKPVRPISYVEDPWEYPMTSKVIKVVITPVTEAAGDRR